MNVITLYQLLVEHNLVRFKINVRTSKRIQKTLRSCINFKIVNSKANFDLRKNEAKYFEIKL